VTTLIEITCKLACPLTCVDRRNVFGSRKGTVAGANVSGFSDAFRILSCQDQLQWTTTNVSFPSRLPLKNNSARSTNLSWGDWSYFTFLFLLGQVSMVLGDLDGHIRFWKQGYQARIPISIDACPVIVNTHMPLRSNPCHHLHRDPGMPSPQRRRYNDGTPTCHCEFAVLHFLPLLLLNLPLFSPVSFFISAW